MSRTLKLADELLALGRSYSRLGRDGEALRVLGKLAGFGGLPEAVAEEAGSHLAELYFRRHNYPKARRQLAAGLARRPNNARFHFLMATNLMEDEEGDLERALQHYPLAARLEPRNADYHCDYGRCLLAVGDESEGLKQLRKAVGLAPEEVKHVRQLALAELEAGRADQARRTVLALLFRRPRDPHVKKLWDDLRFEAARLAQGAERARWSLATDSEPVLLRFEPRSRAKSSARAARSARLRLSALPGRRSPKRTRQQSP